MTAIPIAINASRVKVLVVGGGTVGTRRALDFLAAGAEVLVVGRELSDDIVREAARTERLVARAREYQTGDIGDALLVIAATDDREVNARVHGDAIEASRMSSIADDPEAGSFHSMSVHRSGPLTIGVSAGGVPAAAIRIRDRIAGLLGGGYPDAIGRLMAIRRDLISQDDRDGWRRISKQVIDERFCETVESGDFDRKLSSCR